MAQSTVPDCQPAMGKKKTEKDLKKKAKRQATKQPTSFLWG